MSSKNYNNPAEGEWRIEKKITGDQERYHLYQWTFDLYGDTGKERTWVWMESHVPVNNRNGMGRATLEDCLNKIRDESLTSYAYYDSKGNLIGRENNKGFVRADGIDPDPAPEAVNIAEEAA